jgi:hypothetical protein
MRNKIILVNAVIVIIVAVLSYVTVRGAVLGAATNMAQLTDRAEHDAQGAAARFQLDGLRAEQWLLAKTTESTVLDVYAKSDPRARNEAATAAADSIFSAAKTARAFEGVVPSLVVLVDTNGRVIGRNGSALSRGDDLASTYPSVKFALDKQRAVSDVWFNRERNDQFLASVAPVVEKGELKGAIAVGTTLNDALTRVSDATTGHAVLLVVPQKGGELAIAAHSSQSNDTLSQMAAGSFKAGIQSTIDSGHTAVLDENGTIAAAAPLEEFGDGKHGVMVAGLPDALVENAGSLPVPIFFAMGLGIVLVVMGGWLLGNYISRPINMLEEGLLAILNGQHDKRFELDHAELGGLAFRIDQLLNQLMGVEEDTTDEEGRVSSIPRVQNFADAMGVESKSGDALDSAAIAALANEPAPQYYARLYREYIEAKRAFGEDTAHITEQTFAARIQGMEKEAQAKGGRPVRYKVQAQNREVTLLAIPL